MQKIAVAGSVAALILSLSTANGHGPIEQRLDAWAPASLSATLSAPTSDDANQGFLYGRVTTDDGATHTGRLRFGRDEEAFWGDYFNGVKRENPWAARAGAQVDTRRAITIFGFELPFGQKGPDLHRPFMARFGDIARIEARGRDVRVTLKSGTVFDLDRMAANDFDDGIRVWDDEQGVLDLRSWAGGLPPPERVRIRTIDFLPTVPSGVAPGRLHGTVHTAHGDFTGFVQWNRQECVGADELNGRTSEGATAVRFDTIRSIARRSSDSSLVTLRDGREIVLSGTREVGHENNGIYVDDARYGRVLVSWDAFQRIDFTAASDSGPAYSQFPPGHPLSGTVTTRAGRRLTGRLVYDLDESETTETLDAPSSGVDYTIPLGLIGSIAIGGGNDSARRATVTLHDGARLQLNRAGDLGEGNAGVLIFVDGAERAEYVPWADVERIELKRPPAMYPPLGGR